MNNFKKHPIFTAVIALLLVAFVAGVCYDVVLISQEEKATKNAKNLQSRYEQAIAKDPGKENLQLADKNLSLLRDKLNVLDKDLSNKSSEILRPSPYKQGYALQEYMRSTVQKWSMDAIDKGIEVPNKFDYSFKKYVEDNAKPMADDAVNSIWKQFNVLEYIVKQLLDSKPASSSLRILSIQRELLPEEKAATEKASTNSRVRRGRAISDGDTFEIDKFISARKEGSVSALAYKVSFTGYTESMRRFLNNLNSYDLMLVVRSVEVKPYVERAVVSTTTKKSSSDDFSDLFSDEETPEEKVVVSAEAQREPVVSENLSEFTFVIEYVEVDKTTAPVQALQSEGEDK